MGFFAASGALIAAGKAVMGGLFAGNPVVPETGTGSNPLADSLRKNASSLDPSMMILTGTPNDFTDTQANEPSPSQIRDQPVNAEIPLDPSSQANALFARWYNEGQYDIELLKLAADLNDVTAQWFLARSYQEGKKGVSQDFLAAEKWYKKAADGGDINAIGKLADLYDHHREIFHKPQTDSITLWLLAAAKDPYSHNFPLTNIFQRQTGTPNNEALSLLRTSVDQGNCAAQYQLGRAMYYGINMPQNQEDGLHYLQKAASQGYLQAKEELCKISPSASSEVGDLKHLPDGPSKAEALLRHWRDEGRCNIEQLKEAADLGNVDAQWYLASSYRDGTNGVSQDIQKAGQWYTEAAKKGDTISMVNLASLYREYSNKLNKTLDDSITLWVEAAKQDPNFDYHLTKIFQEKNDHLTKDSLANLGIAAAAGNRCAQYHLGRAMYYGINMPIDQKHGHSFLQQAADQGYPHAIRELKHIQNDNKA